MLVPRSGFAACLLAALLVAVRGSAAGSVFFCPPAENGRCAVGKRTSSSLFVVMEKRILTMLDWLLELHDLHCDMEVRGRIRRFFALFETLRSAACASRFSECGSEMEELLQADCGLANEQGHELGVELGFSTGACSDMSNFIKDASMAAIKLGQNLQLESHPCSHMSDDFEYLLYPADRSPGGICAPDRLPLHHSIAKPGSPAFGRVSPWRDITSHIPPGHLISVGAALEILSEVSTQSPKMFDAVGLRWVVNLGAADGGCSAGAHYDPANCLALKYRTHRAVLVEGSQESFAELRRQVSEAEGETGAGHHRLINAYVTPETVVEMIASALPTSEPALLKVDIDNADCTLVRQLLMVFSPLLLHVEINTLIPPPIVFRQKFQGMDESIGETGRFRRLASHTLGCSLAAMLEDANAGRPSSGAEAFVDSSTAGPTPAGMFRYEVLHVEHSNAVLVREDALDVLRFVLGNTSASTVEADAEAKWRLGYLCHPLARHLYGHEFEARLDVRAFADPTVGVEHRERRVRAWLEREAPGAGDAGDYELSVPQAAR